MSDSNHTSDEYDLVNHDETALSPDDLAQVRKWLDPTDYLAESGEFRRHLSSQAPGTGLWICETEEYRKWHGSADHGSLWIKGVPGAGKSVVAASVIQHLRTTEDCPVLFFFIRNIIAANFTPRALIRDWLAQLLSYSPKLQFALHSRLESSQADVSDNDLLEIFLDGASTVPKLYCIVDALDEMTTDNRPYLDNLNALATHRPGSLKLLITSRPKQHLQSALRDSSIVHVSLQQKLVDCDIMSYLNYRFDLILKPDVSDQVKRSIIDMVTKRSQGLFLYSKLTMDQVEQALQSANSVNIQTIEESLPVGLEQIYTNVLAKQRAHGVDIDTQILVLEAVTHASRPLRLAELASLIQCVCPGIIAPHGFKALVSTCFGPLVEILEDETLQVIHHSFTEFLRGDERTTKGDASSDFPVINSDQAHKRMAVNCLRYLQSGSLLLQSESVQGLPGPEITYRAPEHIASWDDTMGKDPFEYREARLLHPFVSYAVENWTYHASQHNIKDEEFFDAVIEFVKPDSLSFRRWLVLQWGSTTKTKESTEGIPTALHIAAFCGLSELMSELIHRGLSVFEVDAQDRTALHWAAENGHEKAVSLLLGHASDPNPEDCHGLKPIHLAARRDHVAAVKLLLEAGVEPNTTRSEKIHDEQIAASFKKGECAIFYAAQAGHTNIIMAMVPFCNSEVLEQLLCECCRFNRTEAVLAMLNNSNVSANATYRKATALALSCASVNLKCVEALINRGADVCKASLALPRNGYDDFWDKTCATPLHCLVREWNTNNDPACQQIFHLLLEANVDLEQLDDGRNTALLVAAGARSATNRAIRRVRVPALRALLNAGAEVNKMNNYGYTALHEVILIGRNHDAVRLLIEHGSNPNQTTDEGGYAALHLCINDKYWRAHEKTKVIVKYLLEHGADPDLRNDTGRTPAEMGLFTNLDVFQMLISWSRSDSTKKRCWFELYHLEPIETFVKRLDILMAEGVDIDTRKEDGRTLFLCCLESEAKMEALQSRGAKVDAIDNDGNNALHLFCQACERWHDICPENGALRKRLQKLIDRGLDPLSTNKNGDTLLHHIASWCYFDESTVEDARWLLDLGIPVNAVNSQGATALHSTQTKEFPVFIPNCVHFIKAVKIRKELDFEIRNKDGLTPLHIAVTRSREGPEVLMAAGADITALTSNSQNILHLLCQNGQSDMVGEFIGFLEPAAVNQRDSDGRTPLHLACSSGQAELVSLLLRHGADVNAQDSDGWTPLHACAKFVKKPMTWKLSVSNREPWYQDRRRQSPCDGVGIAHQMTRIVRLLLEAHVDVSCLNRDRLTALDVALHNGCSEVIEVFGDEELLEQATEHLERGVMPWPVREIRELMRAQIALMRPKSSLRLLGQDKAAYDQVLKSPHRFINLLIDEDAAKIGNENFESDPFDSRNYEFLKAIVTSGRLNLVQGVSKLVLQYSHYEAAKVTLERAENDGTNLDYFSRLGQGPPSRLTALQLACTCSTLNMLMLQLLVDTIHVDVNARCAVLSPGDFNHAPLLSSPDIVPGGTALHVLASKRCWWKIEAMRWLITKGAIVDARDEKGQMPLHVAASSVYDDGLGKNHWVLPTVRLLLENGADPNSLDDKGASPLHQAISNTEVMQELLRCGASATAGTRRSPLFVAIERRNLSALDVLLDHGASVDAFYHDEEAFYCASYAPARPRKVYALYSASTAVSTFAFLADPCSLLCRLIERGADLYVPLNADETLIHFVFEHSIYEVKELLLQEPCLSRIDFNRRDQHGRTVLMTACVWQKFMIPREQENWGPRTDWPPLRMLDYGADATLVDDQGKTALHHLSHNPAMPDDALLQFANRKEVAPTLLLKDNDGFTPLHYALRAMRPEVCNLMISKGADLLEPDPTGLTALHHIAAKCLSTYLWHKGKMNKTQPEEYFDQCLSVWKLFLARGGDINVLDSNGNSPLFTYLSSEEGNSPMCHLDHYAKLFPADSGVNVLLTNHAGETALHVISRRGSRSGKVKKKHDKMLFEAMLREGVDPLKEDLQGRSALDVATAFEKHEILEILKRKEGLKETEGIIYSSEEDEDEEEY